MGRPSKLQPELIDEICERISVGETLSEICRGEHMPTRRTVNRWEENDPDVLSRIARAREEGEDYIAEQCLAIADDTRNDYMEKLNSDGDPVGYQLNSEHVQRSKLRIETRLKLLAKWNPRKYGERQHVEHSGSISNLSDEELEERIKALQGDD